VPSDWLVIISINQPIKMKRFTNVTDYNGLQAIPQEFDVDAGAAATIGRGAIVIFTSGGQYVTEGTNGLTSAGDVVGIAAGPSDETASVDGKVLVYRSPALRANAVASVPANLEAADRLDKCTLDVDVTATGDHTVDESNTTNGWIRILTFDNTTDGNLTVEVPCRYVLWT
jgi:hypothetical protein